MLNKVGAELTQFVDVHLLRRRRAILLIIEPKKSMGISKNAIFGNNLKARQNHEHQIQMQILDHL